VWVKAHEDRNPVTTSLGMGAPTNFLSEAEP
jgi:hypothetical protein